MVCCNILCCFGCLSLCGCRDTITRHLVFLPPDASYRIVHEKIPDPRDPTNPPHVEVCMYLVNDGKMEYPVDSNMLKYNVVQTEHFTEVAMYFLPYPSADFTIIFSHGNATDIGQMRDFLLDLRKRLKVNIVAYDYSGYGLSSGAPSVSATQNDIRAVYKYTRETLGIPSNRIIFYGQSLGTGVSCQFLPTLEEPIAGVVLHSPLLSGLRVVSNIVDTYWFDIYPTIDNIKKLTCPVWVIHGTSDDLIPLWHGYMLSTLIQDDFQYPAWFVKGGKHNDIEITYRKEFFNRYEAFISNLRKNLNLKRGARTTDTENRNHAEIV